MKSPVKDIEDYIKQEDYHSFFLQGLVHNYYMFLDVFEEWLGKSTPLPPSSTTRSVYKEHFYREPPA